MATAITPTPEAVEAVRPTPEGLDQLSEQYFAAETDYDKADATFKKIEAELIELVKKFGIVPPNAECSRRLEGKLTELVMTIANSITIDEARVQDLKDALEANKYGHLFANLFTPRVRHELVEGADVAIIAAGMPKRLTEKIRSLFGRCFDAKKKKPSLKVKKIAEIKTKKPRAKKAKAKAAAATA